MRCTQIRGLTIDAENFLNENCNQVPKKFCPHCQGVLVLGRECEVYEDASEAGMFDDGPNLLNYHLKDGSVVSEVIQEIVWSSGPCIFMCLQDESGNRIHEWPTNEIENA